MNILKKLKPTAVWEIFDTICNIPHSSGHEKTLALKLAQIAQDANLICKFDTYGNLRVERPKTTGSTILMQAHLDMVPQSDDPNFDFLTQPITPRLDGDYLYATHTTLGADNGIGVAAGLALLMDKSFECNNTLALLITMEEETGLSGALNLSTEMLDCDYLLNLDSEEDGLFYIGCAGGARLSITQPLELTSPYPNLEGQKITISGLKGGHSGVDIDKKRGNALQELIKFLSQNPEVQVSSIEGGSVDNAIPREASAIVALSNAIELTTKAQTYASELSEHLDVTAQITITPVATPQKVLTQSFLTQLIKTLQSTPIGVVSYNYDLEVVKSSNNLASIHTNDDTFKICMSQRSLVDVERVELTTLISKQFQKIGATTLETSSYPGWTPQIDSPLLSKAQDIYAQLYNMRPPLLVMHAGLECGILAGKNPDMQLISFGPTIESPHSPMERVEISTVSKFYDFLKELCKNL